MKNFTKLIAVALFVTLNVTNLTGHAQSTFPCT